MRLPEARHSLAAPVAPAISQVMRLRNVFDYQILRTLNRPETLQTLRARGSALIDVANPF
jgi:hypothetical protein